MRKQFDPREMQHLIDQRNELVSQAAAAFAEALRSGALNPTAEGFEQGDDGAPPGPWPPSKDTPPEGEARPVVRVQHVWVVARWHVLRWRCCVC